MSGPKKHHYLPQFYLRGFSANARNVFQIEKGGDAAYLCAIEDAAAIRDFHTLDYEGCPDPVALERRLSDLEGEWAATLEEVLGGRPLGGQRRRSLLEFVAVMRMRVPAVKEFIETFEAGVVRAVAKRLEREGKAPRLPEPFESLSLVDHVRIHIRNWKLLESMFDRGLDPAHLEALNAMASTLLRAPSGNAFFTCDQPVALFHPRATQNDAYGVGPATSGVEVSFPLSSQVALLLTHEPNSPVSRDLTAVEVQEFNRRTVVMAQEYVFAPERSSAAQAMVARYATTTAGAALDVAETGDGSYHVLPVTPEESHR
jgi:Protein of unknown function (DUF4238)